MSLFKKSPGRGAPGHGTSYKYKKLIFVDIAESPLYELQQEFVLKGYDNFFPIVADIKDNSRLGNIFQEYKMVSKA